MESNSATNAASGSLKKGPWTASEDAILMDYVRKHGEGNWNSVQKNSGLMRCGKSCRLRWANHLRPNLKKGSFTPDEERIIIELHAKLGNKWARMASQLPGRTDNEIKNFWNTRMKRRQRAGLPIYPQEDQSTATHPQHPYQQLNPTPFAPLVSGRKPDYNSSAPFLNSITFSPAFNPHQNHFNNSPFYSNPSLQFKPFPNNTNSNLGLPLSPVPFSANFTDNSIPRTPPSLQYNNVDFSNKMSFTKLIMGDQQPGFIPNLNPDIPLTQTPPSRPNTPFLSHTNSGVCLLDNELREDRSSGLLDDVLMESNNRGQKEKSHCENSLGMSDKGKRKMDELSGEKEDEEEEEKEGSKRVKFSSANSGASNDITSSQSSIGMKPRDEPMEEMNSMDDDLICLLDNFPTTTPLPEWYRKRNMSDGMSSGTRGEVQEAETQRKSPARPAASTNETQNVEWGLGSTSPYWDRIY